MHRQAMHKLLPGQVQILLRCSCHTGGCKHPKKIEAIMSGKTKVALTAMLAELHGTAARKRKREVAWTIQERW